MNMSPPRSPDNSHDHPSAYPEAPSDLPLRAGSGSDLSNLVVGELRRNVRHSARGTVPALLRHIGHVVLVGSGPEVGRIHAWRIVAMVENVHPFRDCAVGDFPCDPVGFFGPPAGVESSVSVLSFGRGPEPALGGAATIDLGPKSGDRARIVLSHVAPPVRCGQGPAGFQPGAVPILSRHPSMEGR